MKALYTEAVMSIVEWASEDVIRTSQDAPWITDTTFEPESAVDNENDLPWDMVE